MLKDAFLSIVLYSCIINAGLQHVHYFSNGQYHHCIMLITSKLMHVGYVTVVGRINSSFYCLIMTLFGPSFIIRLYMQRILVISSFHRDNNTGKFTSIIRNIFIYLVFKQNRYKLSPL